MNQEICRKLREVIDAVSDPTLKAALEAVYRKLGCDGGVTTQGGGGGHTDPD